MGKAERFLFACCLTTAIVALSTRERALAAPSDPAAAPVPAPTEKILWDRLEPPDLPKGKPTAEPTVEKQELNSPEAREQEIQNLKREIEILKDRVGVIEKKINPVDYPVPTK